MMKIRFALMSAFVVIVLAGVFAVVTPAAQASEQDARAFVQATADDVVAILTDTATSEDSKQQKLETLFVKNVDIKWIGRFVLGKEWRKLGDKQQAAYQENYKDFLVANYTQNFREYTGDTKYSITKSRPLTREGQYLVGMEIEQKQNPQPIKIDYRLHKTGKNFTINDIIVEGVSLLTTQRSEFSSVVQRQGIDYLIQKLATKEVAVN